MKLCVFLPSPLRDYHAKGELKHRYYNPLNTFKEVHVVEFEAGPSDPSPLQMVVGQAKLNVHPIGVMSLPTLPAIWRRLNLLVKTIRPDVIRAYDPSWRGALAVARAQRWERPVVVSIHTHLGDKRRVMGNRLGPLEGALERYTLRRADRVLCVSEHVLSYARSMGAARPKLLYNCIECDRFVPPAGHLEKWPRNNPPVVLAVSRLVPSKNLACLLEAVAPLNVILHIVGSGPERSKLEALAHRLGLADRLTMTSSIPHTAIQSEYHRADLFALPTLLEGFCMPVGEAMAAGLPVVTSDIPVLQEVGGEAAVRVAPTPADFRQAIRGLLDRPEEARKRVEQGLLEARRFDAPIWEAREAGVYAELLGIEAPRGHWSSSAHPVAFPN